MSMGCRLWHGGRMRLALGLRITGPVARTNLSAWRCHWLSLCNCPAVPSAGGSVSRGRVHHVYTEHGWFADVKQILYLQMSRISLPDKFPQCKIYWLLICLTCLCVHGEKFQILSSSLIFSLHNLSWQSALSAAICAWFKIPVQAPPSVVGYTIYQVGWIARLGSGVKGEPALWDIYTISCERSNPAVDFVWYRMILPFLNCNWLQSLIHREYTIVCRILRTRMCFWLISWSARLIGSSWWFETKPNYCCSKAICLFLTEILPPPAQIQIYFNSLES